MLNHISFRRGTITGKVYNQYSYDREKREALIAWGERLERIVGRADLQEDRKPQSGSTLVRTHDILPANTQPKFPSHTGSTPAPVKP